MRARRVERACSGVRARARDRRSRDVREDFDYIFSVRRRERAPGCIARAVSLRLGAGGDDGVVEALGDDAALVREPLGASNEPAPVVLDELQLLKRVERIALTVHVVCQRPELPRRRLRGHEPKRWRLTGLHSLLHSLLLLLRAEDAAGCRRRDAAEESGAHRWIQRVRRRLSGSKARERAAPRCGHAPARCLNEARRGPSGSSGRSGYRTGDRGVTGKWVHAGHRVRSRRRFS